MALNLTNSEIAEWYLKLINIWWEELPNIELYEKIAEKIRETKNSIAWIFEKWWVDSLPFWAKTNQLVSEILTSWIDESISRAIDEQENKRNFIFNNPSTRNHTTTMISSSNNDIWEEDGEWEKDEAFYNAIESLFDNPIYEEND